MRFKIWKVANNLGRVELARQLRMSIQALDRIMSGKSWPRSESAEKIFEITEGQVTIEDLYEEWLLYRKRKQNLGRHLRDRSLPRSARMMER